MSRSFVVFGALCVALAATGCAGMVTQSQRDNIAGKMAAARAPLAQCYATALKADPNCHGNVTVTFRVQPNTGRFTNVKVLRSQIAQPNFTTCVASAVGELYIAPAPAFIIDVTDYTLSFAPLQ